MKRTYSQIGLDERRKIARWRLVESADTTPTATPTVWPSAGA